MGVPEGIVPEGAVPFIAPPVCPSGGVPDGAVPFISPPMPEGAVPLGAVPFICSPGVPDGATPLPAAACWESVVAGVDVTPALSVDEEAEFVELVHPAIMIPAMRIADAINITIMLFFMDYSPDASGLHHFTGGDPFNYPFNVSGLF